MDQSTKIKRPMKATSPTKLWDLEYRGKLVYGCQGLPIQVIQYKKTSLLLSGNYQGKFFKLKYHKS